MKNGVMKNGRPILGLAEKLSGCYICSEMASLCS